MDAELKSILLEIVDDLEGLRANLGVHSQYVISLPTITEAREAKGLALQINHEAYDKLRKRIEVLEL